MNEPKAMPSTLERESFEREVAPSGCTRVVVVGAGIAGLAAAQRLQDLDGSLLVAVLEASACPGGKLALGQIAGQQVDVGAESILNRRPEGVDLARAVGLGEDLVNPETISARVWSRGAMHDLPPSMMGVPYDVAALSSSTLISAAGAARAALDLVRPPTEVTDDVSAGWLIEQRFGAEVVDRMLEPLLGGVYAGHARELSAKATIPGVFDLLGAQRSLSKAAAAKNADRAGADQAVFAGIRGGVARLPLALASSMRVHYGTTVREVVPTAAASHSYRVITGSSDQPQVWHADAVVLAVPGAPAARLLRLLMPAASRVLDSVPYASMAVITLAFGAEQLPDLAGSGFLVPPVDGRDIKAATFSSRKWRWLAEQAPDLVIMRASIGRHLEEAVLQRSDDELIALALGDLTEAVGLSVRPVDATVTRWGGGLPQYAVGHVAKVDAILTEAKSMAGLGLCGALYRGLGIPACIATAHEAADKVHQDLVARGQGAARTMAP